MDFEKAFEGVRDPLDFHEALSTATDPRVEMGVLLAIDANRTTSPALQSGLTRNRLQSGLTRNRPETGSFPAAPKCKKRRARWKRYRGRVPGILAHSRSKSSAQAQE